MKLQVKCDWCGNTCPNGTKHKSRNCHNFCSRSCYIAFKTKKKCVKCDWCGCEFLKKESDIKRTNSNFCSSVCAVSYLRWTGKAGRSPKVGGVEIHRTIAEKMLGRKLTSNEEVHHVDFNHQNNRPENLMVLTKSEHSKIHAARKERDSSGRFIAKISNA